MISLSKVCSTRAELPVEFDGGEVLTIVHNPAIFTSEFEQKMREDIEKNAASEFLVRTLSQMLISWDLVDDEGLILGDEHKGEIVPTDAATLAKVPCSILIRVSNAIAASQGSETNDTKKTENVPTPSGSFS